MHGIAKADTLSHNISQNPRSKNLRKQSSISIFIHLNISKCKLEISQFGDGIEPP